MCPPLAVMADKDPPSPVHKGFPFAFRRLRIESAMTSQGEPAMTEKA